MSYLRGHGRIEGRYCGGGGRACIGGKAKWSLGDVLTTASSSGLTADIVGDPTVALIAQLNRFVGKSLSYGTKGSSVPVRSAFPLVPALTDAAAFAAAVIVQARYANTTLDVWSDSKTLWINQGIAGDTTSFVRTNLQEITTTIAAYGDTLGLPPAKVGITKPVVPAAGLDMKMMAIAGGLLVVALLVTRRK